MQLSYKTLSDCDQASGVIVVIDVIRAFTSAACAFEAGASEITLVGEVAEARQLKSFSPDSLLMGEVNGFRIDGFDFGNSPVELLEQDLTRKRLIQRTSSGTQGMVRSKHASLLLASSFVCAEATVRFLQRLRPREVTFVLTGITQDGLGDEDTACAEYLSALLRDETPDPGPYLERVYYSLDAERTRRSTPSGAVDLDVCVQLDRFPFAQSARRENGRLVMRPVYP